MYSVLWLVDVIFHPIDCALLYLHLFIYLPHALSIPYSFFSVLRWTLSSFISYASSIITIGIISHLLGVAEMLCYSYVWFILYAANILSTALYNSVYKHVYCHIKNRTEYKVPMSLETGIYLCLQRWACSISACLSEVRDAY